LRSALASALAWQPSRAPEPSLARSDRSPDYFDLDLDLDQRMREVGEC